MLTATTDTFTVNTSSGYGLSTDITITISQSVGFTTTAGTLTFYNPGTYSLTASESSNSDIVYVDGNQQTVYAQENYSGPISFGYPCSVSGSNTIASSLIAYPATGTYPSWVSLNADYMHIDVVAPAYGSTNTYYFGVRSVIFGQNIDKYGTINVYKCLVAN